MALQLERKVVRRKEAPVTLWAADNSSCVVSEQRFNEVVLGERVRCGWQ